MSADQRTQRTDRPTVGLRDQHDGYRFICRRDGAGIRVFSRPGNDWTDRVPLIAEALKALRAKSVTIDGEGIVCGPDGVSDFDRLRAAVGRKGSRKAFLYAFDLLELDGVDLGRELWSERRKVLVRLLRHTGDGIRLSEQPMRLHEAGQVNHIPPINHFSGGSNEIGSLRHGRERHQPVGRRGRHPWSEHGRRAQ